MPEMQPSSELKFTIPDEPVAKERARSAAVGVRGNGKPNIRTYTPAATVAYEKKVAIVAQIAVNQRRWAWGPKDRFTVIVRLFRRYEGKGGDIDNYIKSLFDGLNGVVWDDDRAVRSLAVTLSGPSEKPRTEVVIRRHRIGERSHKLSTKP